MSLTIEQALQQAVEAHRAGKLQEAELLYRAILQERPTHPAANHNLGVLAISANRTTASLPLFKAALEADPSQGQFWLSYIDALIRDNKFNSAKQVLQQGKQRGLAGARVDALAARLEENELLEHYQQGRYELATSLASSLTQKFPEHQLSWRVLGAALIKTGKFHEALVASQEAARLLSTDETAYLNLGIAQHKLGRLEDAEASYRRAIAAQPLFAEAHGNLGMILLEKNNLAAALDSAIRAIKIAPNAVAKFVFREATKKLNPRSWDLSLAHMVRAALLEPWGRPADYSAFACRLIRLDPAFLQYAERIRKRQGGAEGVLESTPLLLALLSSDPIPDLEMEDFLAALRARLLRAARDHGNTGADKHGLTLHCALAQQCFINEYVYSPTPGEDKDAEDLRDRLAKALEKEEAIPPGWIAAVACYFPLHSVSGSEKLLQRHWPDDVRAVLRQQVEEPLVELDLRASLPRLTDTDNQVSLAVMRQYEESPYPRWVRLPRQSVKKFLNAHIQGNFPSANFHRLADDRNPDILIAGCGTGQHPIETAQAIEGARILAIDLSATSLAYAKRKTMELGIRSIEYAQADLLKLAALDRTFDVIESCGVLHHLDDPLEGWKVLLSRLRPRGLMRLGFYSELGRRDILKVRALFRQEGRVLSPQEVRTYRQHVLERQRTEDFGFATSSSDFFSTSGCRDLLFHVQEHRMGLDSIAGFLKAHDLEFLGFELETSAIRAYKSRFPNDPSATDLACWRVYEEENPDTFRGMYQFWVQKQQ